MEIDNQLEILNKRKNELIAQQAISRREKEESERNIELIKEQVSKLKEEDYKILRESGISIDFLKELDYDRLLKDEEFLQSVVQQISEKTSKLYDSVMEDIDV
jgi:hypothetical protein